jgi:tyrosine-protein kinase Etk/Wzc
MVEVERSRRMPSFGACQVVAVSGCSGGEGASAIAVGLARAAAAAGRRVLAVDARPGSPHVVVALGGEQRQGLVEWAQGGASLDRLQQPTALPGVSVLAPGAAEGAGALIRPDRIQATFASIGGAHDLLVVDTPALATSAHAQVFARYADLVLLVVEAGRTTEDELEAAARELARVEPVAARIVLNRARA